MTPQNYQTTIEVYQDTIVRLQANYPQNDTRLTQLVLGLAGEAGEATEMIKKLLRDGEEGFSSSLFIKELGDVVAYVTILADYFGSSLSKLLGHDYYMVLNRHEGNKDLKGMSLQALGLVVATGQATNSLRDHLYEGLTPPQLTKLLKQLTRVLLYIGRLAEYFGYTLLDVLQVNQDKLVSRAERGTLQGSGNTR
jgi:NTP pyrophosphatase (non-canonical NTP hydrolase)